MKKALLVLAILCVGISASLSGCLQEGTGTLILQITDAPGDLNITEALVTISNIDVHKSSWQNNTTADWFTVVQGPLTFDLIQLENVTDLLGSANISAGLYTQIRLYVDNALVTIDGTQYNLTIPSKTVKLIKPFIVENNETLVLILDFDIQKSVKVTGSGKYYMKPTIKVIQE